MSRRTSRGEQASRAAKQVQLAPRPKEARTGMGMDAAQQVQLAPRPKEVRMDARRKSVWTPEGSPYGRPKEARTGMGMDAAQQARMGTGMGPDILCRPPSPRPRYHQKTPPFLAAFLFDGRGDWSRTPAHIFKVSPCSSTTQ